MNKEIRMAIVAPEIRETAAGKIAAGYAALFNSETGIGDYFREKIAPGAFSESIAADDIRALYDHDSGRLLGRTSSGTLRLSEDDKGLAVEIDLPDTSDGRDLQVLLERGDISGMSFGFIVRHDEWDETVDPPLRTIHQVDLREVSAVGDPAYADTEIALRSRDAAKEEKEKADKEAEKKVAGYFQRKADAENRFRKI